MPDSLHCTRSHEQAHLFPVCAHPNLHAHADDLLEVLTDYERSFDGTGSDGVHCVFYHCEATRELSRRYGDLLYKVADLEVGSAAGAYMQMYVQEYGSCIAACCLRPQCASTGNHAQRC